jgi:hypothetical protein
VFARAGAPKAEFAWPSRLVLWLLGAVIIANAVAVFALEGLHWTLPDDPTSYRLFDLLRA